MATIIPTSEDDPVLSVVRFTAELAWDDAGPEVASPQVDRLCLEAQDCMVMGRWLDLANLMLTSADLIFSRISEKDLECIFTVICNLVTRASSVDEAHEMAKLISTKVIQQPTDKPALRLKIMFNLYNLLENPYTRFFVYTMSLNLALSGKVTDIIIPSFKKVDNLLKEWNIEKLDQRKLFLSISNILKDSKSKDSFHFLTKYLSTFSVEDSHAMSEAKEEAVRAIIEFVKAPDMFQCDLLELPAVTQLEKDGKYAPVYELLKIFLTKRLNGYLDFEAANSSLLKSYGVVHDDSVRKMRLMSLADLGSSGDIPYSVIRDTLCVTDDEVEYWVVKAISAKILDCKMDQMNEIVVVSRRTERLFGLTHWKALRSKLGAWRTHVGEMIGTIQANKIPEENGVPVQAR